MDFLLECIGFPPNQDFEELARLARERGESVPWRGPSGVHLRMSLGDGLELRMDREAGSRNWTLYPHFSSARRMRVAVQEVADLPDSPFDALLFGWANPPLAGDPRSSAESYPIAAVITDARRLPRRLEAGRVLALTLSAFALDIDYVGPADPTRPVRGRPFADGGWIAPLGGTDAPGGCVELSLAVRACRTLENPVTGSRVPLYEVELPDRPMPLFANPWQLQADGLPEPCVGARIEGSFLLTGRIAGGLGSSTERLGDRFG